MSMNILSITYLVIMALGVGWVIYRIIHYLRAERERDSVSQLMFSEDRFKAYLEDLKNRNGDAADYAPPRGPKPSSEA
ncbi:MAG: hypothetical protein V1792_07240 [Pseudomonadota bacterium]